MAEPIHRYLDDDYSGPHGSSDDPRFALRQDFIEKTAGVPAARSRWQCPWCLRLYERRKACEKHMGLIEGLPANCKAMPR
jgi:hypothetical protein